MTGWGHLDSQMAMFQDRLTGAIKLSPEVARRLATNIAAEVRFLSPDQKLSIRASSPIPIGERLSELQALSRLDGLDQGIKK
jgi:hypothetical protein